MTVDRHALVEDASTREDLLLAVGIRVDIVRAAMQEIGVHPNDSAVFIEPTDEQRERAFEPPKGLRGMALARYILTGQRQQRGA